MRPADRPRPRYRLAPLAVAALIAAALPAVARADLTAPMGSPIALGSANEVTDIATGNMDAGTKPDIVAVTFGEHVFVLLGDGSAPRSLRFTIVSG
jgi:hypothetical protein